MDEAIGSLTTTCHNAVHVPVPNMNLFVPDPHDDDTHYDGKANLPVNITSIYSYCKLVGTGVPCDCMECYIYYICTTKEIQKNET